MAVAGVGALGAAFAVSGAAQGVGFGAHQSVAPRGEHSELAALGAAVRGAGGEPVVVGRVDFVEPAATGVTLERAGLIRLNPAVDKWTATQKDIVANPKNLKFTLLNFAAQSRSLPDLDAAVGYTEYYLAAKVPLQQQIFAPPAPDEFAGQLTIGSRWADTDNIKKLVETFNDPALQQFLAADPSVKGMLMPL